MKGTIKWYHATKHFGFLMVDTENREVFFHVNDCMGFTPKEGMRVEFEFGFDKNGRSKAIRVNRVSVGVNNGNEK